MSQAPSPEPLSRLFESVQPEARLQRVWGKIEARRRRRASAWTKRQVGLGVLACVILSVGIWFAVAKEGVGGGAPRMVATVVEATTRAHELDFGDGAHVTVGPGGRLDVLEQSAHAVNLALRRGLAQFDIRPGGARRWQVEIAGVTVEVVGTRFSVERSPSTVRVEVQHGRVLVRGPRVPDGVQALDVGRTLVVDVTGDGPRPAPPSDPISPSPTLAAPDVSASQAPAAPPLSSSKSPPSSWRQAASAQDWRRAWDSLGTDGVSRQSQQTESVADLFLLADVARRSGHPEAAVGPLQKIVERHPRDARAGVAAFTLGRTWLDALHDPARAVSAFRSALALKLPGTLAEDAQARLVEALSRSGASGEAHRAAELYRRRFPSGARRTDVDRWSPPR